MGMIGNKESVQNRSESPKINKKRGILSGQTSPVQITDQAKKKKKKKRKMLVKRPG
jgi:hypothetical protein